MKKIVILKHGGGELANQLWNYVSIYSYGLEMDVSVQNPSFFEYHSFFNFLKNESFTTRFLSLFFKQPRRRSHPINRFFRSLYALRTRFIAAVCPSCVVSSQNASNEVFYLSSANPLAENVNCEVLYFSGWLFRNPKGLEKYRTKLITAFAPNQTIQNQAEEIVESLRKIKNTVLGIHIRQADYKVFKDGQYIVSPARMREIVEEYIQQKRFGTKDIALLVTSDGPINESVFIGLHTYISRENAVVDLFLLSKCDALIGSNSSFGAFASWYGNIPHIVATNEAMDWNYYSDQEKFFENIYATLAPH